MTYTAIRRLTPELIKYSNFHFNVLWSGEKYMLIELTEKPKKNIWNSISNSNNEIEQNISFQRTQEQLALLDRYR